MTSRLPNSTRPYRPTNRAVVNERAARELVRLLVQGPDALDWQAIMLSSLPGALHAESRGWLELRTSRNSASRLVWVRLRDAGLAEALTPRCDRIGGVET